MEDRLVIGFAGPPGAGKTSAARLAAEHYQMSYYCPGELIRAEAKLQSRELPDRATGMLFLHEIEADRGPNVLIDPILNNEGAMAVDGLRRMYDLKILRSTPGIRFILVAIKARLQDCHPRALSRPGGRRDSDDFEIFQAAALAEAWNESPMEPSVEEVMADADHTIDNNFETPDEFLRAVKELLDSIRSENT